MKIRSGFVSNSSSASFILSIKGKTEEDLKEYIQSISYDYYLDHDCFKYIRSKLVEQQNEKEKLLNTPKGKRIFYSDEVLNNNIQELQTYIDLIDSNIPNKDKIIPLFTYMEHITLEHTPGNINLYGWVPMFNDYNNCPEILKDLCVFCVANEIPVSINVQED